KEKKSSYLAATIIYISFIVVMIFSDYVTAFLFNNNDLQNYNLLRTFLLLAGLLILFVGANYLVSSLQSGEGFFKDIYLSTAYALAPIIVFTPFLVLLTHGLTYNESFIYSSLQSITIAWSLILVIVMLKEVHNYTIKELIINILLTLFAMVMIVVILALLYLLTNQLYEYVMGILKEVFVYARV
ncbi:MAG: YIP1 family protein, partial [Acholeplasmataceae bacterium]|nr:YIP1 family protein [Acholeplasmataceae bacterium]